eukprot:gene34069-42013_t
MTLCMGMVCLFFVCALGVALQGMQAAKNRFQGFLEQDQALLMTATNMYAQGLQMGQALRNVVLDPANKTGHKNLEDAGNAFKEHSTTALELARDHPANLAIFQKVSELRNKQATLQAKVATLAREDQAA